MPHTTSTQTLLNPAEEWWAPLAARDDSSAVDLLQTEVLGGRHQRSVYELFSDMTEKDGHLYAILQTRLNGLLCLPRRIIAAPPADETARGAATLVEEKLGRIPRLEALLRALLDGIAKGFAAIELLWGYDAAGHLTVVDWFAHPQEWFAFSPRGELLLLAPPFRKPPGETSSETRPFAAAGRTGVAAQDAFPSPQRKFLLLRFGADFRNPYGCGLMQRAYWLYWLKKNTLKFWACFNERYGSPTAVARYGPGTTSEDRQQLREILDALQTNTGIVLPESIELQLIEAGRSGHGGSYREFLDWCNDEMSKVVLGATLTSGEGRRSGSLALGSIHQLVRQDYIEADARMLESVLNETLVRWICEANLGTSIPVPYFAIETESPEDLGERMTVDRELLALGVSLPQSYFYERYSRPAPTDADTALRFDDANFYKYHLQYGVLTINEVRERLGLPPVSWGTRQTRTTEIDPDDSPEDNGRKPR